MDSYGNAVRCGKSKYKGGTSTRKRTNSTAGLTATVAGAIDVRDYLPGDPCWRAHGMF